ncbi:hypothetical protein [Herbidospora sp. RD11066]
MDIGRLLPITYRLGKVNHSGMPECLTEIAEEISPRHPGVSLPETLT